MIRRLSVSLKPSDLPLKVRPTFSMTDKLDLRPFNIQVGEMEVSRKELEMHRKQLFQFPIGTHMFVFVSVLFCSC